MSGVLRRRPGLVRRETGRILALSLLVLTVAAGRSALLAAESSFVHDTVREPVPDLFRLEVPPEPANRALAGLGLLDVTAAPFDADPSGERDATRAIQAAVDFARDHQMVCFFPPGTYRVSDTIHCVQGHYRRQHGKVSAAGNFPCVLVGSRQGARRPRIVLADRSPGFGDPEHPRYVVHFRARSLEEPDRPQPNISFHQRFRAIDIVIGEGNPGAVGIRHRAAQGSGVEECTIDARHGHTGLEGGAGSGGSHADVTVIGGVIGLDLRETQPAPTVTGVTLLRQSGPAILNGSRQTLCVVGSRIVRDRPGPAIVCRPGWDVPFHGLLVLADSEVVFESPDPRNAVVESNRGFYLHDVYVRRAARLARLPDGPGPEGRDDGWLHVRCCAWPLPAPAYRGRAYRSSVIVDGKRLPGRLLDTRPVERPPPDLRERHLWPGDVPGLGAPGAVDVRRPPYSARGDGVHDDTEALQKALDDHEAVFLPKGIYRLSRTLRLGPRSKLVGISRVFSVLALRGPEAGFTDAGDPRPLVATSDAPAGDAVLAHCGIYVPSEVPGAYALRWSVGRRSVVRDVGFLLMPGVGYGRRPPDHAPRSSPFVVIAGGGGGKWYDFELGRGLAVPGYRHLLVEGTREPLRFYQCCPEGARSEANLELRDCRDVAIYGLKGEGNSPIVLAKGSSEVSVFGYGGNAAARPGSALFRLEGCRDILLAGLVDHPIPAGREAIRGAVGVDPSTWHMVIDLPEPGTEEVRSPIVTAPLERPLLYRRSGPWPSR